MYIAASAKIIDGKGNLGPVLSLEDQLRGAGLRVQTYDIAPLNLRWQAPLPENCLRSACSPMQAVDIAKDLFENDQADALVLRGYDQLKSGYSKEERQKLMQCFPDGRTHFDGYVALAEAFVKEKEITIEQFHSYSDALFNNYLRTFKDRYPDRPDPNETWFNFLNDYFRGVDCANPYVDFSGAMVIVSEKAADICQIPDSSRIRIVSSQLKEAGSDSIEQVSCVVKYDHLQSVYRDACNEADVDFTSLFLSGDALLEVYTCYSAVPMAFLLATGMVKDLSELPTFLETNEITVTAGLNLNRASWNNTTMNNIITMCELLREDRSIQYGGIHGNGSLGYQQGFMILKRG